MKIIAMCIVGVIVLVVGLWPQSAQQQEDPKAAIKRQHRDARYGGQHNSITNMDNGEVRVYWPHFVEPAEENAETPQQEAIVQNRLAREQITKRKEVACAANFVVLGKVKDL